MIELLVALAMLALLTVTLLPALAGTRQNSQAIVCLANQKQLIAAWSMYAGDNNGTLVVNHADNSPTDNTLSWVTGWEDYNGSAADTNTAFLTSPQYSLLGPYVQSPGVFKCPTDHSCQFGLSGAPRVRSYSMNIAVGPGGIPGQDPHAKAGSSGDNSWLPWPTYRVFIKESDLISPTPSQLWVIIDEEPDSINDGCFAVRMTTSPAGTEWIDIPSKAHGGGCDFAFADGHSEIHRWVRSGNIANVTYQPPVQNGISELNDPDILWMDERTSSFSDGRPLPY